MHRGASPFLHLFVKTISHKNRDGTHWPRIRSNNGLERLNAEIKRRVRAVGAFPDRDSALRLITAVALETTAVWGQRRYLDMALLGQKAPKAA